MNVQQIHATARAFAAVLADKSVATWGRTAYGGYSAKVRDQLRNVKHIYATRRAFAASLADGSFVMWGDPARGGNSTAVSDQFRYL